MDLRPVAVPSTTNGKRKRDGEFTFSDFNFMSACAQLFQFDVIVFDLFFSWFSLRVYREHDDALV